MDSLLILSRFSILAITILLLVFEFGERGSGRGASDMGYEYYTPDGSRVRIRHIAGMVYKVYVFDDDCPVQTGQDRFGKCFTVRAGSAQEAEYAVDDLYQQ